MIPLKLELLREGDPAPLEGQTVETAMGAREIVVRVVERGLASGKPSVSIAVRKDDGSWFLCETSAALFLTAAGGVRAFCERLGFRNLA